MVDFGLTWGETERLFGGYFGGLDRRFSVDLDLAVRKESESGVEEMMNQSEGLSVECKKKRYEEREERSSF